MSEKNIQIDSNNNENSVQRPEKSFFRKNLPIIGAVVGVVVVGIVIGLIPVYKSTSDTSTQEIDSTQSSIMPGQTSTSTSSLPAKSATSSSTTTTSTTSSTTTTTITTTTTTTTTSTTTTSTTTTTTSTTTTTIQTCIIKTNINSVYPSDYNSNSCPKNYFAEPNNLTLTDSFFFNYPVIQVIYCYGTKVSLQCPGNQVLKFLAVYYGIQPNTNTDFCRLGYVQHDACYWVPENIVRGCEGEQKCEIEVKDGLLGDPCKGSNNHQLFFQYQCIDLDRFDEINSCSKNITKKSICSPLTPGAQNNFWCENEVLISCPSGLIIRILCAFYGIDPNFKICPKGFYTGSPDTCYSSESQTYMETICNGRNFCRIPDLDRNIPDYLKVCSGYQNILYAEWECVASLITTTTQAPSTVSTLPFCPFEQNLIGSCVSQTFSPHVPVEIENSTSTYFGFPIVEYTLCQDSIMVLTCPTDLVIHIHAAYFGIQPNTSRSLCMSDSELPVCYTNTGYETILRACEAKSSCSLLATANTISGVDLCPSHSKQLFVQYQCVDAIGWNKTISKCQVNTDLPEICPAINETENMLEQTWCEDSDMNIECVSGRIEVVCAFYGLHPSVSECGNLEYINFKPVCYFESSFNYIDALCSNQTRCEISDYSVFSDPCTDFQKAIYVQWKCV